MVKESDDSCSMTDHDVGLKEQTDQPVCPSYSTPQPDHSIHEIRVAEAGEPDPVYSCCFSDPCSLGCDFGELMLLRRVPLT